MSKVYIATNHLGKLGPEGTLQAILELTSPIDSDDRVIVKATTGKYSNELGKRDAKLSKIADLLLEQVTKEGYDLDPNREKQQIRGNLTEDQAAILTDGIALIKKD